MSANDYFGARVSPRHGERSARNTADNSGIVIGAPVVATGTKDSRGSLIMTKAAKGANKPLPGLGGVANRDPLFRADEFAIITHTNQYEITEGMPFQVWSGSTVKIFLSNINGFVAVDGLGGATNTVNVGDFLTPGDGNLEDGIWEVTADAAKAWLVVTDVSGDSLDARLNF